MTENQMKTALVVAAVLLATLYVNKHYLHVERLLPAGF
jgi:hypothetical protein